MDRYVDPNSGAAPQPGGQVSPASNTGVTQEAQDQEEVQLAAQTQDEATQVSSEQQDEAMSRELGKQELLDLARRRGLQVNQSMTKAELRHLLGYSRPL